MVAVMGQLSDADSEDEDPHSTCPPSMLMENVLAWKL